MGKILDKALTVLTIAILIWFLWSWINIMCHNEPLTGDFVYSKYNLIIGIVNFGSRFMH